MDTSKTYIKMCEKADEIQNEWKPQEGDCCVEKQYPDIPLFLFEDVRGWGFITARGWEEDDIFSQKESIWLPHQDQLQAMLNMSVSKAEREFHAAYVSWDIGAEEEKDNTWEQLWFALVMERKYNKIWDGEDWKEVERGK